MTVQQDINRDKPDTADLFTIDRFQKARERIRAHVKRTDCPRSTMLSRYVAGDVFLKLEQQQKTGSFKIRGVMNKLLSLGPEEKKKELIAASTGNHAGAFAYALSILGLNGRICVPKNINPAKEAALASYPVPVRQIGNDCIETENFARDLARKRDAIFISPYNDPEIIQGQGSIGLELMEQIDQFDCVLVPVGGGGLISGIALALKQRYPTIEIIGCQPENSAIMYQSIRNGRIIEAESQPTMADATAGGIEQASITFEICKKYVDHFVLLTETEILAAFRYLHLSEHIAAEAGSAMTVAALKQMGRNFRGKRMALVISGGQVPQSHLEKLGEPDGTYLK